MMRQGCRSRGRFIPHRDPSGCVSLWSIALNTLDSQSQDPHTHTHTDGQFDASCQADVDGFRLWEESRAAGDSGINNSTLFPL